MISKYPPCRPFNSDVIAVMLRTGAKAINHVTRWLLSCEEFSERGVNYTGVDNILGMREVRPQISVSQRR
jgi:hypothetical protein